VDNFLMDWILNQVHTVSMHDYFSWPLNLIFDGLEIQREQSRWWYIRSFISPAQSGRALIELASLWFHDFSTNEVQSIND